LSWRRIFEVSLSEESFAVSLLEESEELFDEGMPFEETKSFLNQNDCLGLFFC
jgi:hypothetical protein